jgi:hypothetical protein
MNQSHQIRKTHADTVSCDPEILLSLWLKKVYFIKSAVGLTVTDSSSVS